MDGDLVTPGPSPTDEDLSLAGLFETLCPHYMAMGMTYWQFWNCPTRMHKAVRKAYEIRNRNEEWSRWRQGAYFMRALAVAMAGFSKNKTNDKYPDEPWPLTQREKGERDAARDRANYEKALAERRAASDAALKRRAEAAKQKEAAGDGDHRQS